VCWCVTVVGATDAVGAELSSGRRADSRYVGECGGV